MRKRDDSKKSMIVEYINEYYNDYGQTPTVHRYLLALMESGELDYNGRNSITTDRIDQEAIHHAAPVLGYVACGEDSEANKTNFTRMVGGLFAGNDCYCVFNTRDSVMKWSGEGEMKARINLEFIYEANAAYSVNRIHSAIIFGVSPEIAMGSIESTKKISRKEYRFDSQFFYIHYVPLNEYGARFLKFLTIPNWKEELLQMLFDDEERIFGCGRFDYDALVHSEEGKKHVLSLLDCDLARLKRFKEALEFYTDVIGEIICYDWMVRYVQKYMEGSDVIIKQISFDFIEKALFDN